MGERFAVEGTVNAFVSHIFLFLFMNLFLNIFKLSNKFNEYYFVAIVPNNSCLHCF